MWKRCGLLILVICQTTALRAALAPDEVAIIALRSSKQSMEMAAYYARARGVPENQICPIDCTAGETLSRDEWETKVRPAIRAWLAGNHLEQKGRCFVTVWDVPLKIGQMDAGNPVVAAVKSNLESQRQVRQKAVVHLAGEIDAVLSANKPPERTVPRADAPPKEYADFLEAALKDAQGRLQEKKDRDPAELVQVNQKLERLYFRGAGLSAVLRAMQGQVEGKPRSNPDLLRTFDVRRGEFTGLRVGLNMLGSLPESTARDLQMLVLLQQTDGLLGALAFIDQQQEFWKKIETYSSFDNELGLVLWPDYPRLRWQNSVLAYSFDPGLREVLPATIIGSRLEAPTFDLTKHLVDTALAVEKEGLSGRVFIDARGMGADKNPGSYGDYDQNLRDLGAWLKEHTTLDITLDNKDRLFQKGDCP